MRRLSIFLLALLAGCVGAEEPAVPAATAAPDVQPAVLDPTADPEPSPPIEMPIALDGNTGTSAVACVMPAEQCAFQEVAPGTTGIVIDGLRGTIAGGEIVLSWSASSPATTELSAGFMVMSAEECEGFELGSARGVSPLTIAIQEMDRPLCEGELVHLWVAGTNWGDAAGQAFYQIDIDQAFRAEGAFTLSVPPAH